MFGDAHGNVVHLFERECSIQRRHQKVDRGEPVPRAHARRCATHGRRRRSRPRAPPGTQRRHDRVPARGHGDAARFYFLEMNTRLQVEHPVTEAVTGVDLVRAQLVVAAGGALPWTQDDARRSAATRSNAASTPKTRRRFLPQAGPLLLYREPAGPGIRVDSGVARRGRRCPSTTIRCWRSSRVSAETRDAAIARAPSPRCARSPSSASDQRPVPDQAARPPGGSGAGNSTPVHRRAPRRADCRPRDAGRGGRRRGRHAALRRLGDAARLPGRASPGALDPWTAIRDGGASDGRARLILRERAARQGRRWPTTERCRSTTPADP